MSGSFQSHGPYCETPLGLLGMRAEKSAVARHPHPEEPPRGASRRMGSKETGL